MRDISDVLIVSFSNGLKDGSGLCVTRKYGEKIITLKMELGEQADILYRLLTEQMTKAEIKAESEEFQPEPFINKPCVSEQACHEDKMKVLEKIRAELERRGGNDEKAFCKGLNESYKLGLREAIDIINKYMAESEKEE